MGKVSRDLVSRLSDLRREWFAPSSEMAATITEAIEMIRCMNSEVRELKNAPGPEGESECWEGNQEQ